MRIADKYSKAGTLSLHLQKYQSSPKFTSAQPPSQVPSEEIMLPPIRHLERESPKLSRKSSKSKEKHIEKSSVIKLSSGRPSQLVQEEDEDSIFQQCVNLTSRIENFKVQKYQLAVQEYEEQERKKLQFLYAKQKKLVSLKYSQKRKELQSVKDRQSNRLSKALEESKKYKEAYQNILQDLTDKKKRLEDESRLATDKVKDVKVTLVSEWKRASNEEVHRHVRMI